MSPLIRAGKLIKEPLILETPRLRSEADRRRGPVTAVKADPVAIETGMTFDHTAVTADRSHPMHESMPMHNDMSASAEQHHSDLMSGRIGAAAAAAALTYVEYKERIQQEIDAQREAAVADGYREGEVRAREQIEAEYAERIQNLGAIIASARQQLDSDVEALHEIGVEVVYEAVLKLLGTALVTRAGAHAAVREVIRRAKDTTRLVVRLSPADFEELNGGRTALLENLNGAAVEVLPDERVELGGCLLETPAGNLDGRMEVQLQCLRETLLSARARRPDGGAIA